MTLREWWKAARKSKHVYWVCDHASRTNMGAYYSLYTVSQGELVRAWPDSGEGYDEKLAKRLGFRLGRGRGVHGLRSWYRGGCGYNRPFDIVDSIAREFQLKGASGEHWSRSVSIEHLGEG